MTIIDGINRTIQLNRRAATARISRKEEDVAQTAQHVLDAVNEIRRPVLGSASLEIEAQANLLKTITSNVSAGNPIPTIFLGFPFKSPNTWTRVLGRRADLAEELAIKTLAGFCGRVESVYSPGADLLIVSDGRIACEALGISDNTVEEYREDVIRISTAISAQIRWTSLDDFYPKTLSPQELRGRFLEEHGKTLDEIDRAINTNPDKKNQYLGYVQFHEQDLSRESGLSHRAIIREAKRVAKELLRRSDAFASFIDQRHADFIRFSIHVQNHSSKKHGLKNLVTRDEQVGTPWYNVVGLRRSGEVRLLKKSEAEHQGLRLILKDGQPYYFSDERILS